MFVAVGLGFQIPLLRVIPKPEGTNPKGTKENSLKERVCQYSHTFEVRERERERDVYIYLYIYISILRS